MNEPPLVHIYYLRPPDREQIFTQHLIWEDAQVKITFSTDLTFDPPLRIDDEIVLETGSQVIWFTFPDAWHDVGLFHRADGTFTGTYANILTPCSFEEDRTWRTTLAPPISLDSRLAKTAGPERKGRDGPEAEGEQGDRRS